MDAAFAAAVAEWHDFYATTAGVAATLVGLLFVALALNPAIMADHGPAGLRTWAGQTFHSFLIVLVIAMIMLAPGASPSAFTITFAIIGGQGVVRVAHDIRMARTDPDPTWHGRRAFLLALSPMIAYLIALWVALAVWRGDFDAIDWLIAVVFFLVISASASCWDLLKEIGDRHRTATAAAAARPAGRHVAPRSRPARSGPVAGKRRSAAAGRTPSSVDR